MDTSRAGLSRGMAGAIAAAVLVCAPSAAANTIDVTTSGDVSSPGCSLRSAISAANTDAASGGCPAGSGADTIVLHTATYKLAKAGRNEDNDATGDLDIKSPVTITGDGSDKSIIDAASIDRVIEIFSGNVVVLKDLAVTHGVLGTGTKSDPVTESRTDHTALGGPGGLGGDGGGIKSAGDLTVDHVLVKSNTAGTGGGGGNATHTAGRSAQGGGGARGGHGGGIANFGQLHVVDSRIASNLAGTGGAGGIGRGGAPTSPGPDGATGTGGSGGSGGSGGGIYTRTPATIERSVIASNRAGSGGVGGDGVGGNGASNTPPNSGGSGGAGNAGTGGHGGFGGGIVVDTTSGTTSITDSAVTGNFAGNGGLGLNATGGHGGDGGGTVFYPGGGASVLPPGAGGTAAGGTGGYGGSGGGIAEVGGDVNVARTTIAGNKAGSGNYGGAATSGTSGVGGSISSPVQNAATAGSSGDGGSGGGIATAGSGARTLTDSTVDSNVTGGSVEGNSTASGSPKKGGAGGGAGSGGGVDSHAAPLTITRSTITSNTLGTRALGSAGGANGVVGTAGAIWGGTSTRLSASILANNAAPRCYGTIDDGGSNIDFPADPVCPGTSVDPLLGAMADNGGIGQTRALPAISPAVDSVACTPSTDERGVPRPTGSKCDAGAYEFALPTIGSVSADAGESSASVTAQVTPYDAAATVTFEWGTDASYGTTATQTVNGVATASGVTFPAAGLQPGTTYHYRLTATTPSGTATTGDLTFRTTDLPGPVGGGGGGPIVPSGGGGPITPITPVTPGDETDPVIRSVKADPSKFLVGPKKTPVHGRVRAAKTAVGTKLKFSLSENADVEIAFELKSVGKKGKTRSGKKTCEKTRKPPKHSSDRCTLYVEVGTLTRDGDAGANSIAFSGRVGSRALRAGTYRFIVSASDTAGNDADPVTGKFTVLDPEDDDD